MLVSTPYSGRANRPNSRRVRSSVSLEPVGPPGSGPVLQLEVLNNESQTGACGWSRSGDTYASMDTVAPAAGCDVLAWLCQEWFRRHTLEKNKDSRSHDGDEVQGQVD